MRVGERVRERVGKSGERKIGIVRRNLEDCYSINYSHFFKHPLSRKSGKIQ